MLHLGHTLFITPLFIIYKSLQKVSQVYSMFLVFVTLQKTLHTSWSRAIYRTDHPNSRSQCKTPARFCTLLFLNNLISLLHGRIQVGGQGVRPPPLFAHVVGFLTLGLKLEPLLPPLFACKPKMDPPPLSKNSGSAPVTAFYSNFR